MDPVALDLLGNGLNPPERSVCQAIWADFPAKHLAKLKRDLYFSYTELMEDLRPPEIPPRYDVRICLSAFRDAHVIKL